MARLTFLLAFALLGAADLAAVVIAMGRIGSSALSPMIAAAAIHGLVSVLAAAAIRLHPLSRNRAGAGTLALLAAILCLMTPVLGCIMAAWVTGPPLETRKKPRLFSGIRFAPSLDLAACPSQTSATLFTSPLATALREEDRALQRLAVPRIRQISDRRALAVLRDLNDQPDARTHLYAQAALATGFERRERQIDALRRAASRESDDGESLCRHERLATALLHQARLYPESAPALVREASACYERALAIDPADAACLLGAALCLIRLGEPDAVPDLYGRLCAVAGASRLADRLELSYLSALGNWRRAAETAGRLTRDANAPVDLGAASRQFWLATP